MVYIFLVGAKIMLNNLMYGVKSQIDENETAANTHPHASAIQMPKQNVIIL
jgi:hypothetical protein